MGNTAADAVDHGASLPLRNHHSHALVDREWIAIEPEIDDGGKHILSASSVLNPRQFQHISCPVAVNLSMRNASYNVFGIPHFIRATDAHIAVAIYSLLTPTTLQRKHIRHQAITFIFLIIPVWAPFSTTLKRLPMIVSWTPLSLHDLQAWTGNKFEQSERLNCATS